MNESLSLCDECSESEKPGGGASRRAELGPLPEPGPEELGGPEEWGSEGSAWVDEGGGGTPSYKWCSECFKS